MSWVKMDDCWPQDPRVQQVQPLDRLLWAMSAAYSAGQDTDGFVDFAMLEVVGFCAGVPDPFQAALRLERAGLYEPNWRNGWHITGWREMRGTTERPFALSVLFGTPRDKQCTYCGKQAESWDHILPKSRGGKDCRSNLAPACKSCNSSKGARTPREWWERRHGPQPMPAHWPNAEEVAR